MIKMLNPVLFMEIKRRAYKFVCLLSANHSCVLQPVDQLRVLDFCSTQFKILPQLISIHVLLKTSKTCPPVIRLHVEKFVIFCVFQQISISRQIASFPLISFQELFSQILFSYVFRHFFQFSFIKCNAYTAVQKKTFIHQELFYGP